MNKRVTSTAERDNIPPVLFSVTMMVMVLVGLHKASNARQRSRWRDVAVFDPVIDRHPRFAGYTGPFLLLSTRLRGFALGCPVPFFSSLQNTRFAQRLNGNACLTSLVELVTWLYRLATLAELFVYNSFSHGVNLLNRFVRGQSRASAYDAYAARAIVGRS